MNCRAAALLLVVRSGKLGKLIQSRSISWVEHGYRLVVAVTATSRGQVLLTDAQLVAVADGLRL